MKTAQTQHTEDLCRALAHHLSTRKECRGEEYVLGIHDGTVVFWPNIEVYPDRFTRRNGTKLPVVEHVLKLHFSGCGFNKDKFGMITVDPTYFVDGTYRYRISVDKRSRKWFRSRKGGTR